MNSWKNMRGCGTKLPNFSTWRRPPTQHFRQTGIQMTKGNAPLPAKFFSDIGIEKTRSRSQMLSLR